MQLFDPEHPPTGQVRAHADPEAGWTGATIAITEAALIAEYGRRCGIGGGDR